MQITTELSLTIGVSTPKMSYSTSYMLGPLGLENYYNRILTDRGSRWRLAVLGKHACTPVKSLRRKEDQLHVLQRAWQRLARIAPTHRQKSGRKEKKWMAVHSNSSGKKTCSFFPMFSGIACIHRQKLSSSSLYSSPPGPAMVWAMGCHRFRFAKMLRPDGHWKRYHGLPAQR